jgi:hypothetical protein
MNNKYRNLRPGWHFRYIGQDEDLVTAKKLSDLASDIDATQYKTKELKEKTVYLNKTTDTLK